MKQTFPEVIETQRLVLRCYQAEDAFGILELVQQVLLWHLAETRERANRANPGKERCLGNSIGRVRLFHQHVVAKTGICEREH